MLRKDIFVLAESLGIALQRKHWTVTTAESCTGGGIAFALTDIAGSSQWFAQSLVTYSNNAKQQLLKVNPQHLDDYGAVSEQVVADMLSGAITLASAEVAIAVSGVAGPDGGTKEKPVGTVWIGCQVGEQSSIQRFLFSGDRYQVRMETIREALSMTLEQVTKASQ